MPGERLSGHRLPAAGNEYGGLKKVERLQAHGLGIRRREELHGYENAHAERLNGILKQDGLGYSFRRKQQALEAIDEGVFLYNTKRPHLSLNYETPEKMHRRIA
ncbi:MAG: integrase core domain-containing protein [Spirochaetaceae bacterium]|nr:integrase core domain-containing protein [Spirochaetaceae bacterium]